MPGEAFGRYQLLEKLAVGGMGEVFLAVDRGSAGAAETYQKPCVVKRILPALATQTDVVAMFAREATFAAQLSHANIVQVHDHGVVDGRPYTAMEFVHGINAKALLELHQKAGMAVPVHVAVHVMTGCAAALAYAHHRRGWDGKPLQLVHRDISPHNVLLSLAGEVKLADFGMVKGNAVRGVFQTTENTLRGKLAYMSPEQAAGAPVDQRSDIFSWGVLAYELLTRRHPFADGADGLDLLDRIKRSAHARVDTLRVDLPPPLVDLVERCLRSDPVDRPSNSQRLLEELEDVRAQHVGAASNTALSRHLATLPIPPLPEPVLSALARPQRTTQESLAPVSSTTPAAQPVRARAGNTQEAIRPVLPVASAALTDADDDEPLAQAFPWVWVAVGCSALLGGGLAWWSASHVAAPDTPSAPPSAAAAPEPTPLPPPGESLPRRRMPAPRRAPTVELPSPPVEDNAALDALKDARALPPPAQATTPTAPAPPRAAHEAQEVTLAAPTAALAALVPPPGSPGMPGDEGLRFNASQPVDLRLGGKSVAVALQGAVPLDGPGPHALELWTTAGVHLLTLEVLGEAPRRRARVRPRAAGTVLMDGRMLGVDSDVPVKTGGSALAQSSPQVGVSLTVR